MTVTDLGRLKKLPKNHPFSGGLISFARKPPKGWPTGSENLESSSQKPLDQESKERQKQIEQEAREQMSGSPTTDEPKDSKNK